MVMADVKQEKMATRQAYGKALVEIGSGKPKSCGHGCRPFQSPR